MPKQDSLQTLVADALQGNAVCSHCGHEGTLAYPEDLAQIAIETVLESHEISDLKLPYPTRPIKY